MTWTTEKPTVPGWYYAYGHYYTFPDNIYSGTPPPKTKPYIEIFQLTLVSYDDGETQELCMNEGTNGEQPLSSDIMGFTHWMLCPLPEPPL